MEETILNPELEAILFRKSIRTVYINTKTVSDLTDYLELLLANNYFEHKVAKRSKFLLGNSVLLVDIRQNTYYKSSRLFKDNADQWFEPANLTKYFTSFKKIDYVYCKALGNPKKIRDTKKPNLSKTAYLAYIQNHIEQKKAINRLYNVANRSRNKIILVLMCYCEPDKNFCHRFAVLEQLVNMKREALGLEPTTFPLYIIEKYENLFTSMKKTQKIKSQQQGAKISE